VRAAHNAAGFDETQPGRAQNPFVSKGASGGGASSASAVAMVQVSTAAAVVAVAFAAACACLAASTFFFARGRYEDVDVSHAVAFDQSPPPARPPERPAKPRLTLFVGVLSCATGWHRRARIRRTWLTGAVAAPRVEARFFIGGAGGDVHPALAAEMQEHHDVVVLDVSDKYSALVDKTTGMFAWATSAFDPMFVLKVDDDTYINVGAVRAVVRGLPEHMAYWGKMQTGPVLRGSHRNAENNVPKGMETFPPYASGAGYILSGDLARHAGMRRAWTVRMTNEDAYVGVVLLPLKVHRVNSNHIYVDGIRACTRTEDVHVVHYVDATKTDAALGCMDEMHARVVGGAPTVCRSWRCPAKCDYNESKGWRACPKSAIPAAWALVSSKAVCEGNDEGVKRFAHQSDVLDATCCRKLCDETCGCSAVDFFTVSSWCNLYRKSCAKPTTTKDGGSSWRRHALDATVVSA